MIKLLNQKISVSQLKLASFVKQFSSLISSGDIVLFNGNMGCGKTTFIIELLKLYNYQNVSSPTFSLVNKYNADIEFYHLDLYRLETMEDLFSIDIDYYFELKDSIVLIEWAEKLKDYLPENFIKVELEYCNEDTRLITVNKNSSIK